MTNHSYLPSKRMVVRLRVVIALSTRSKDPSNVPTRLHHPKYLYLLQPSPYFPQAVLNLLYLSCTLLVRCHRVVNKGSRLLPSASLRFLLFAYIAPCVRAFIVSCVGIYCTLCLAFVASVFAHSLRIPLKGYEPCAPLILLCLPDTAVNLLLSVPCCLASSLG